jgi:hypothetical protein
VADVLFLAILVVFFSIAVVFVRACDHIIGPDLEADATADASLDATGTERAAA